MPRPVATSPRCPSPPDASSATRAVQPYLQHGAACLHCAMAQPPFPIEMMPRRRRGVGLVIALWVLVIGFGLYSLLGALGVPVPFWKDHLQFKGAWPPVELVSVPHRPDEPR